MTFFRRTALGILLLASLARPARSGCIPYWQQKTTPIDVRRMAAGDFNGDGRSEIAVASENSVALVTVGSDGTIDPTLRSQTNITSIRGLATGDVTGDGKRDVVVTSNTQSTIFVLPGNGDATLGSVITTSTEIAPGKLVLDDFDEDGKLDAAFLRDASNEVGVWHGVGDGTFTKSGRTTILSNASAIATGDFDGDGFRDIAVTFYDAAIVDVLFGNGDGTFDPVVSVPAHVAWNLAVADFDDDGDDDLAMVDWVASTVTTIVSTAGRTFGAPAMVSLSPGNLYDVVAADVNDDGAVDLVVSATDGRFVATFIGNDDGTFRTPARAFLNMYPMILIAGQFTDDDRVDFVTADITANVTNRATVLVNTCGDATIIVEKDYAIVSAGQESSVRVFLSGGDASQFSPSPPLPTGTVKIFEGATELGSATLAFGQATIPVAGLPAGDHTLFARYSGDSSYHTSDSATFVQKVTSETSSATLTCSKPEPDVYGDQISMAARAFAPNGDEIPYSLFRMFVDGVNTETATGAPITFSEFPTAGTHTFQVRFLGNATVPPSYSNTITRTVQKATTETFLQGQHTSRYGSTSLPIVVGSFTPSHPTGVVTLFEGNSVTGLITINQSSNLATFSLPALSIGTHTFHATYAGDSNHEASASANFAFTVLPNDPFPLIAEGSASSATVQWLAPSGTDYVTVERNSGSGWQQIASLTFPTQYTDPLASGTAAIYRAFARKNGGAIVATSNADVAVATSFTDDPLTSGTIMKAQHMNELVNAANAVRSLAGLPPLTLSVAPGTLIRASDLTTLRDGINAARTAAGVPLFDFSDTLTPASTVIRALHVAQLRDAVR